MKTSILKQISKTAERIIKPQLLKSGIVLDIRRWEDGATIEIDLHLPETDMTEWGEVPYIKLAPGDLFFRDYIPFGWDAETATCSLFIEITQEGTDSNWAKHMKAGDHLNYLMTDGTHTSPHPANLIVGLGDATSLAHLLALQQLTLPDSRFDGAALISCLSTSKLFKEYFTTPLTIVPDQNEMVNWLMNRGYCVSHTSFYLTGNHQFKVEMRKLLKSLGYSQVNL
ncbi:hypothetical protein [Pedobacter sp. L105]|uniref:hypothetical protein n=1 Tax=Pedobacter sp. L105 TaxID=1641871 RepID=UPI00131CB383|nr:hypothetical protein [Pedobacter sp. L105]